MSLNNIELCSCCNTTIDINSDKNFIRYEQSIYCHIKCLIKEHFELLGYGAFSELQDNLQESDNKIEELEQEIEDMKQFCEERDRFEDHLKKIYYKLDSVYAIDDYEKQEDMISELIEYYHDEIDTDLW